MCNYYIGIAEIDSIVTLIWIDKNLKAVMHFNICMTLFITNTIGALKKSSTVYDLARNSGYWSLVGLLMY